MSAVLGHSLCFYVALCVIREVLSVPTRRDHYNVLGLDRDATDHEIKAMFRKLALKYHPDKNESPDAEHRFQEVLRAFEVLSDPMKRRMHDVKLGMEDQYRLKYGGGVLPNLRDLAIVSDQVPGPGRPFDSEEVVTGFYVMVDHVANFDPPPDSFLQPRNGIRLPGSLEPGADLGSITCTTFTKGDSGDDTAGARHTQCR